MDFNHAIRSQMADMGLSDRELDTSEPLQLIFDERWELTCEQDQDTDDVVFSIPLKNVGKNLLEAADNALKVLNQSLLGAHTAGCACAYSEDLDCLVIWRRYPNDFSDGQMVANIMSRMVDVAEFMDEWCNQNLSEDQPRGLMDLGPGASMNLQDDIPAAGWFRV